MTKVAKVVLTLAAISMTGGATGQSRADFILNFDSLATPGNSSVSIDTPYAQDGFVFSSSSSTGFAVWETGNSNYAGATALFNNSNHETTMLQRADGGAFDLKTIDMSLLFNTNGQTAEDTFTGIRADSSVVTQTITFGPTFGFQTYGLTGFTNVVSVSWSDDEFPTQFDNLLLSGSIPEPSSIILTGLGGLLAYGWRRKSRN